MLFHVNDLDFGRHGSKGQEGCLKSCMKHEVVSVGRPADDLLQA